MNAACPQLAQMLAPIEVDTFFGRYWRDESLYIKGHTGKFEGLDFNLDKYFRIAEGRSFSWQGRTFKRSIGVYAAYFEENGEYGQITIPGNMARSLYDAGMTVCIQELDADHPLLETLCDQIRQEAGYKHAVVCNAYLSPDKQGFGLHFDNHSVMILQLQGRKRWRFGRRPSFPSPPIGLHTNNYDIHAFQYRAEGALEIPHEGSKTLQEEILEPGDLLYLAPGTWHRAYGVGMSLALTLAWDARTIVDDVLERLRKEFVRRVAWRQPYEPVLARGQNDALPGGRRFIHDHLLEIATFLQKEAQELLSPPTAKDGAKVPEGGSLRPDMFIRGCGVSPLFLVRQELENGDEALTIHAGDLTFDLPPPWRAVFERLRSGERLQICQVMELTGSMASGEQDLVLETIQNLIHEGALELAR
jgi:hypothetical protein